MKNCLGRGRRDLPRFEAPTETGQGHPTFCDWLGYNLPSMSFPITKPRVIRFRGRTLIDVVPARRSSKDMRHPTAQDKRRFGEASVFFCRRGLWCPPSPLPLPLSSLSSLPSSLWGRVRLSSRRCLLLGLVAIRMASGLILRPCVGRCPSPSGSAFGMVRRASGPFAAVHVSHVWR